MVVHIHKIIRVVLALSCVLLSGCSECKEHQKDDEVYLYETSNNYQADKSSGNLSDFLTVSNETTDFGNELVTNDDLPMFREDFIISINTWKQKNKIIQNNFLYCIIDDYMLISAYDGEIIGNTQTPYIIIDCNDSIIEIDADKILYANCPMFFIKDDVLYLYDYGIAAGIEHTYFVEFSLNNGNKINEYLEAYSLGSDELYKGINTYSNIENTEQLESYKFDVSNRWFTQQVGEWEDFAIN